MNVNEVPNRRRAVYDGDAREVAGSKQLLGPCNRGIFWRPVNAIYDSENDKTTVVFAPVPRDEVMAIASEALTTQRETLADLMAIGLLGGRQ
ncbi:hypothetical protein [Mycobacteroides abscessus]|uniref:hypothetical protein n=1 Tax=Mycobacteroides abscessus TaxID=36809 RepID=UPI0009286715|nr:hypothetical protein [Mycobacteroides abscessus]DAZ90300.1 TPA_asm: hypothetical protein PROPHIFSQJ01-1_14 [Mycobacterium phage prophiFSQJ01-1]SII40283.1 Uncharacterised protein [Mycobacteroides abscessus subsp. abscessus]SIK14977.1 Uncharacterised protein [Mycobacteroides abscessus subsp. abscessus]SIN24888.1 Uncharacterised protein [Mycobacteroides abscessus subsp. abscessus]SLI52080.1 Uncharacterised protein [Mycobacteroides abscessus subsp. abscessus]